MFSLTQASGTDDDMNSLDQFCQMCTTNEVPDSGKSPVDNHSADVGGSSNIVVMHKNSSGTPSVTCGSHAILGGSLPVRSHVSDCSISSALPASHPELVEGGTHLVLFFCKVWC
jgi:hypothetical protein